MKRIISIVLSLLLLLSSSGITYAQHFCGDYEMMAKMTLGQPHLSCGMVMATDGCDAPAEESDCCDNQFTEVTLDEHFAKASFDVEVAPEFVYSFVSTFILAEPLAVPQRSISYTTYRPPPIERDIQVWYETFLI